MRDTLVMERIRRDIGLAVRVLLARRGFSIAVVICTALGMGAHVTMVSIVDAVWLRPLPFERPHELVMVASRPEGRATPAPLRMAAYEELRLAAAAWMRLAVRTFLPVTLGDGMNSNMIQSEVVSASYFDVLRVKPLVGRAFDPTDDATARGGVLISHELWQRRFSGRSDVLGTAIRINGSPMTVIGVMPAGFNGFTQIVAPDAWLPLGARETLGLSNAQDPSGPVFGVIGRLMEIELDEARARAAVMSRQLWPRQDDRQELIIARATGQAAPIGAQDMIRRGAQLLLALGTIVLAISMANVAGLLLIRAIERRREVAVRMAMGAKRIHIAQQLITESVLVALAGAVGGLMLAYACTRLVTVAARLAPHLRVVLDVGPDLRVATYTIGLALFSGVAIGLAPVLHARRTDLVSTIKENGTDGGPPKKRRLLHALVVVQIGAATALLVGLGLLLQSYANLRRIDPGFDPENVIAMTLDARWAADDAARRFQFFRDLLARVRANPVIEASALAEGLPLGGRREVQLLGADTTTPVRVDAMRVSSGYFATLRVPLLHGRDFGDGDRKDSPRVAIVSEALAERTFGRDDPVGKRLSLAGAPGEPIEIIGVVPNLKSRSIAEAARPTLYEAAAQTDTTALTLLVRSKTNASSMAASLRTQVQQFDRNLALVDVLTLREQVESTLNPLSQMVGVFMVLCMFALVLACLGTYGVIHYAVQMRLREYAIRRALGAETRHLVWRVARYGVVLAMIGVPPGYLLSAVIAPRVLPLLFQTSPTAPVIFTGVVAVVVAVVLAAGYGPVRMATLVAPADLLRTE